MASRVRIKWRWAVPFIVTICLISIMTLVRFTARQKPMLAQSLRELHGKFGDGEVKRRRRPDLHHYFHHSKSEFAKENTRGSVAVGTKSKQERSPERLHLAIVACGNRAPGALVSLKSFTMFSKAPLHFHIFTEKNLQSQFLAAMSTWPTVASGQLIFDVKTIRFPEVQNPTEWKMLFKPCASQRLFLTVLMKDVDSLVYVDTDVLTLTPLESIWSLFKNFNSTQLSGLAAESEVAELGWYNRFGRHPYYGKLGLNSGVMLMNLTRMRQVNMTHNLIPLLAKYKSDILWGDQDILNIYFHFHPEMMYSLSCSWNYRADHCMYGNNCPAAEQQGIYVVHGSRDIFHNNKQPEFKVLFDAFESFNLETGSLKALRADIEKGFAKYAGTYCGAMVKAFTKTLVGS